MLLVLHHVLCVFVERVSNFVNSLFGHQVGQDNDLWFLRCVRCDDLQSCVSQSVRDARLENSNTPRVWQWLIQAGQTRNPQASLQPKLQSSQSSPSISFSWGAENPFPLKASRTCRSFNLSRRCRFCSTNCFKQIRPSSFLTRYSDSNPSATLGSIPRHVLRRSCVIRTTYYVRFQMEWVHNMSYLFLLILNTIFWIFKLCVLQYIFFIAHHSSYLVPSDFQY